MNHETKIEISLSLAHNISYEVSIIEKHPDKSEHVSTRYCEHLYDVLREVIANAGGNQISKRHAVAQLVEFYYGKKFVIVELKS